MNPRPNQNYQLFANTCKSQINKLFFSNEMRLQSDIASHLHIRINKSTIYWAYEYNQSTIWVMNDSSTWHIINIIINKSILHFVPTHLFYYTFSIFVIWKISKTTCLLKIWKNSIQQPALKLIKRSVVQIAFTILTRQKCGWEDRFTIDKSMR